MTSNLHNVFQLLINMQILGEKRLKTHMFIKQEDMLFNNGGGVNQMEPHHCIKKAQPENTRD